MQRPRRESMLATLLFTDIVRSTDLVAELGDRRWRILLSRHHALVRRELRRYGGRELDTAGDGFFARFDSPGNAIRCAAAVVEAVQELGIEVRIGLHLGQAEIVGKKLGGAAVHIGARVMGLAGSAEVLVTMGLKDVLPAPDFRFEDHGSHALKGIAGEWHLFRLTAVERPLPGPLEPGVAAERRAAVQAPPLWRRRYVPGAAAVAVLLAGAVGGALLLVKSSAPPPVEPTQPAGLPAHALLRLDPAGGRVEAVMSVGDPMPPLSLDDLCSWKGPRRSMVTGEGSIWVTNGGSDSVLRVDPVSGRGRTIHVPGRPVSVAVGQDAIWVASADGYLTRIDPGTEKTTTIDISASAPTPIDVVTDDRGLVFVTALHCQLTAPIYEALLVRVDGSSVALIPVAAHADPASSVIAVNGSLWKTAGGEGVWKVDPATGKVLKRVSIGIVPGELAADQDGASVWLTAGSSEGQVAWAIEIDASTGRIVNRQPLDCCPGSIAVGDGYVWVTTPSDGRVQRIPQVTGDVAPPIAVGQGVNAIAVGQGGIWVTVDS